MKKASLLLFLLLFTFSCFSQDRKTLEERALKYYTYSVNQQYDSLVNYIHQSIFKSVTRKDLTAYLNKKLSSDQLTLSPINTPPNFYFGEIRKIGETYYCIYYTDQTMKAKFHEEIAKRESDYLIEYTKKRFNADKVMFNPRMNAIISLHRMKDIAIADKESNYVWMFSPEINDRSIREQLGL